MRAGAHAHWSQKRSRPRAAFRWKKSRARPPQPQKSFFDFNRCDEIGWFSWRIARRAIVHCCASRHSDFLHARPTRGIASSLACPSKSWSCSKMESSSRPIRSRLRSSRSSDRPGSRGTPLGEMEIARKNRRRRAARRGLQRSSPHWRNRRARCAGTRSDRDANHLAARTRSAESRTHLNATFTFTARPKSETSAGRQATAASGCDRAMSCVSTTSSGAGAQGQHRECCRWPRPVSESSSRRRAIGEKPPTRSQAPSAR